ncbi:475_t:CDS:2, partial [Entrophospora sp. SA101]
MFKRQINKVNTYLYGLQNKNTFSVITIAEDTTKEPPVSTWEDPRPSYYANLDYPAQIPTAVTSTESKHDHKPTGSSYPAQGKSKKLGGLALGGLGGIWEKPYTRDLVLREWEWVVALREVLKEVGNEVLK